MICDFCCHYPAAEPTKTYLRDTATISMTAELPDGVMIDDGEWLACKHCVELIDGKKWSALVTRCAFGGMAATNMRATHQNIDQMTARSRLVLGAVFGRDFQEA